MRRRAEEKVNEERYQRGKQVRESVLGQAHAARTAKNRTSFNAEFQDFLMEYAWGGIWARPGLDHKTRSRSRCWSVWARWTS